MKNLVMSFMVLLLLAGFGMPKLVYAAEGVKYDDEGVEIEHIYFTYHFVTNGGVQLEDLYCDNYVSETWVLPTPVYRGYHFKGWYTDVTLTQRYDYGIPETGSIRNLYAKWESAGGVSNETRYTISYVLNGGSFTGAYPDAFRSGDIVEIPNPKKTDYVFDGWYLDSAFVTPFSGSVTEIGSFTLYAKWRETGTIPIHYVLNGGEFTGVYPTCFMENKKVSLVSPVRVGYTFTGWFLDAELTKPFTALSAEDEAVTIYAGWERHMPAGQEPTAPQDIFAVFNLHANGGTLNTATYAISQGDTLVLPQPVKTGYTFDGWYMDAALTKRIGSAAISQGEYHLYAKWTEDIYKVLLVLNGTSLEGGTLLSYTYESGLTLPVPKTSSDSLSFIGWYYDRTLKEKCGNIAPGTQTGSFTLYAGVIYNGKDYVSVTESEDDTTKTETVTYTDIVTGEEKVTSSIVMKANTLYYDNVPGSAENPNPSSVRAGDTVILKNPKRKYYLFKGWYRDAEFTQKVTEISYAKDVKSQKIYAKWEYLSLNLKSFHVKNVKKKTLSCKWEKRKAAEGYQIQISLNKKFKAAKKYKTKIYAYSRNKKSAKIKNLKKGKKYYIRIRSYAKDSTGKRCYSAWSICSQPFTIYR